MKRKLRRDRPPRKFPVHHLQYKSRGMVGAPGTVTIDVSPGGRLEFRNQQDNGESSRACLRGAPASLCFDATADEKFGRPTAAEVLELGGGRHGLQLIATRDSDDRAKRMLAILGMDASGRLVNLLPFVYLNEGDHF